MPEFILAVLAVIRVFFRSRSDKVSAGQDARDRCRGARRVFCWNAGETDALIARRTSRRTGQGTVLWVDDDPDINIGERQALEALGLTFVLASSTKRGA